MPTASGDRRNICDVAQRRMKASSWSFEGPTKAVKLPSLSGWGIKRPLKRIKV